MRTATSPICRALGKTTIQAILHHPKLPRPNDPILRLRVQSSHRPPLAQPREVVRCDVEQFWICGVSGDVAGIFFWCGIHGHIINHAYPPPTLVFIYIEAMKNSLIWMLNY
jgi:hypothetical protein